MTFWMKKVLLVGMTAILTISLAATAIADAPNDEGSAEQSDRYPGFLELDRPQLKRGEIQRFDARHVTRIIADDTAVATIMGTRDGSSFTLRGLTAGETKVEVTFSDDTRHTFSVVVTDEIAGFSGELTLPQGESHAMPAIGVHRVQMDDDSVIDISVSDDGQTFLLEAIAAGTSLVYLYSEGDAVKSYRIRVEAQ